MKRITLNGLKLTVYTGEELLNAGAMIDSRYKEIGDDLYLYGLDTKGDYVKASGLSEKGEVDTAVDERYIQTLPYERRESVRHFYVSFYSGKGIGYDLVDVRNLLPMIQAAALKEWKRG